jgi:hypothetical protein
MLKLDLLQNKILQNSTFYDRSMTEKLESFYNPRHFIQFRKKQQQKKLADLTVARDILYSGSLSTTMQRLQTIYTQSYRATTLKM